MIDVIANLNGNYKNCSTQIQAPTDVARKVLDWGSVKIPAEDLYDDGDNACGLENEIHSTILYGLTEDDPKAVEALIGRMAAFDVRFGLVTAFTNNPKYDVVKIDVESPEMMLMHYLLKGSLPNNNKFPDYVSHCTIGYVRKGAAMPLIGNADFRGITFPVNQVMFCGRNKKRVPIQLLPRAAGK